ncbi:unnamed protein product, partial [Mesorhabditis belari]|uniref:Uncharacterized protein n=1 Tax=Mesorhabditis belari TaxID=2138241 RepID=A0AAF3EWV6_9BILA
MFNGATKYNTVSSNGGQKVQYRWMSNGSANLNGPETPTAPQKTQLGKILAGGGARVLKLVTEVGRGPLMNTQRGEEITKDFLDSATKEKEELQDLNSRLEHYILQVQTLEIENRALVEELEKSRSTWGADTSRVKNEFHAELIEKQRKYKDLCIMNAKLEAQIIERKTEREQTRSAYREISVKNKSKTLEYEQVKYSVDEAEQDLVNLKEREKQLNEEKAWLIEDIKLQRVKLEKERENASQERMNRVEAQFEVQRLVAELESLSKIHEQEVYELQLLLSKAPVKTREIFRDKLALAIRDIKKDYEYLAMQEKREMESWYKLRVSQVQSLSGHVAYDGSVHHEEISKIRHSVVEFRARYEILEEKNRTLERTYQTLISKLNKDRESHETAISNGDAELRQLHTEIQKLYLELEEIRNTKLILDAEIAIYRKMVEAEEFRFRRVGAVTPRPKIIEEERESQQIEEHTTIVRLECNSVDNIVFDKVDWENGCYIVLHNKSERDDGDISGYTITRHLPKNEIVSFKIPANTILRAGARLTIYAKNKGAHSPPTSIVNENAPTWGVGFHVETFLRDKNNVQKSAYVKNTAESHTKSPTTYREAFKTSSP